MHGTKTIPDTCGDTLVSMPGLNEESMSFSEISYLVAVAAAWPSIPDPIKAAVKAVLAPYLITEGGE